MAAPRKVCIIGYTAELTMKSSNGLLRIFVIVFLVIAYAAPLRALRFDARPPDERWSIVTRYNYRVRINGRYLGHADREIRETYKMVSRSSRGARVSGWARVIGSTKRDGLPVAARLESSQSVDFFLADNGAVSDAEGRFPSLQGFPVFPDGEINRGDQWEAPIGVGILGPEGRGAVLQSIASYTYTGPAPYQGRDAHYFEVVWALRYQGCAGCRYSEDTLSGILNAVSGSHRVTLVVDDRTGAPVMARNSLRERWEWADSGTEEREGFALIFWKGVPPLDTQAIEQRFKSARLPASPLPRRTRPQPSSPQPLSPGPTSPDQQLSERTPSERPPAGRTPPDQSASAQSPTERPPAGRTSSAQPFSERTPGERTPSGRPPSDRSSAERTASGRTASGPPRPPSAHPPNCPTPDGLTIHPHTRRSLGNPSQPAFRAQHRRNPSRTAPFSMKSLRAQRHPQPYRGGARTPPPTSAAPPIRMPSPKNGPKPLRMNSRPAAQPPAALFSKASAPPNRWTRTTPKQGAVETAVSSCSLSKIDAEDRRIRTKSVGSS